MLARRIAAALALCALAACGGGRASVPSAPVVGATAGSTGSAGTASSASVPYGQSLLAGATYVGAAQVDTVGVDLYPAMRDAAGLRAYAKSANDPASGNYHRWLTPQEIGERFGAPQSDYDALVRVLNAHGIAAKVYPQREMVRVRGPQANVEAVLGARFGVYRAGTATFLALTSAPHLQNGLHVAGLGNAVEVRTRFRDYVPVRAGNGLLQGYSPEQIANAFDYTGAYRAGYTGKGISIGIIGTGPITDGDPRIDGGAGGDVGEYRTLYGVTGSGTVQQVYDLSNVSPGTGQPGSEFSTGLASPPPVTDPNAPGCSGQDLSAITNYETCNPEDTEAQLDTEQASALAPDASVLFYIAFNPSECFGPCGASGSATASQQLGIALSDDEIQQAIADNRSDIISMSFDGSEPSSNGYYFGSGSNDFGPTELASLLAEGDALFVSSGDSGAEGCYLDGTDNADTACVGYPATDPSVVSVGGVNSPLDNSGRLTGPLTGWGAATDGVAGASPGGSGGGCSIYFPAPSYEAGLPNFPCGSLRSQPDVSLDADTATGVAVVLYASPTFAIGRQIESVGGTSVSAPEMAAMWALVLQACKQTSSCATGTGSTPWRLGDPNPYFYNLYQNAQSYAATFYDVQYGNNALPPTTGTGGLDPGYTAGVGYDLVTGIGVPYGRALVKAVTGQ
jgi:kumamolisin